MLSPRHGRWRYATGFAGILLLGLSSAFLPALQRKAPAFRVPRNSGNGEATDWRDFRAGLVQGSEGPSSSWAYSTDLLELGSVILSVPGDYWALRRQYFAKVVMLIIDHGEEGTVGVVLNRPSALSVGDLELDAGESILEFLGLFRGQEWQVWFGGDCEGLESPGKPQHFCMHTLDRFAAASNRVINGIYTMSFREAKLLVATGQARPEDFVLFAGYTGWSPGQLQDELNRGDAWVLGAADATTLLGEEGPLLRRLQHLCGQGEGPGDGVGLWQRLYETLRPSEKLDEGEESHNSLMIQRWVDAYLRSPVRAAPSLDMKVEAGSVLRGSATRWLLGRPLGTWPSRQGVRDAWMVPGQYLHKAVLVLAADCAPDAPAQLILLNGPCIGHTAEGHEVFFGGPGSGPEARTVLPLKQGAVLGRFTLPPGTLHQLLADQSLEVVEQVTLPEIMAMPRQERWLKAGGQLNTLADVTLALEGGRQQKKWYREYLGLDLED